MKFFSADTCVSKTPRAFRQKRVWIGKSRCCVTDPRDASGFRLGFCVFKLGFNVKCVSKFFNFKSVQQYVATFRKFSCIPPAPPKRIPCVCKPAGNENFRLACCTRGITLASLLSVFRKLLHVHVHARNFFGVEIRDKALANIACEAVQH